MARIDELINSLATIIIRYHDSQSVGVAKLCVKENSNPSKMREHAITILKADDYEDQLAALNKECTIDIKYPDRLPFLTFIKDEVVALKKLMAKETSFTDRELALFEIKITRLLTDLKKLLFVPKGKNYEVQVNHLDGASVTSLSLKGMLDPGVTYNDLCVSGKLIRDELLQKLKLDPTSKDEHVAEVAEILCQGHQIALLRAQQETS